MSTVKFIYKSQFITDTIPVKNSVKPITSGAVYDAINNIEMNTLFKSGYLPEGIASVVPQHKLVFADDMLTLKAESKVFIPDGINNETGDFKFKPVVLDEDVSNNRSFSTNLDAYLFYSEEIINNELVKKLVARTKRANMVTQDDEVLDDTIQQVWAQLEQPIIAEDESSDGCVWWDLTNNLIKVFNNGSGEWEVKDYSVPLAVVDAHDGYITGIDQDFILGGVCDNVTWINPGVTLVVPTGLKEEDRTFTNEIIEITDVITKVILVNDYEEFSNYGLYFNLNGEIEGPVDEYAFDSNVGLFIDDNGNYHQSCRYALLSAAHLTTSSRDKLTVTAFSTRPTLALADNDDIEYVIRLIGSSMGLTIDDLQAEIEAAKLDRDKIRNQIKGWLNSYSKTITEDLHHSITHKQMPIKRYFVDANDERHPYFVGSNNEIGFYKETENNPLYFVALTSFIEPDEEDNPVVRYKDKDNNVYDLISEDTSYDVLQPDIAVDETIKGNKTFENTIIGNISGSAQNVRVNQTSGTIIPMGLTSYNANGVNNLYYLNTSVRIGSNYVEAAEFRGTCTSAKWADLAEIYATDEEYPVGTLLKWGGEKELTVATMGIANAVISDKPAFLMNAEGEGQPVALAGRVKVRVTGPVKKHDAIVLNEMKAGVGKVQETSSEVIVARALEDNDDEEEKLVLCVVRFSL